MKTSELIAKLQANIEKHGDIKVTIGYFEDGRNIIGDDLTIHNLNIEGERLVAISDDWLFSN